MSNKDVFKLKVADLKLQLKVRGLKITGNKKELAERLQCALRRKISHANDTESKMNKSLSNKRCAKARKIDNRYKAMIPNVEQPLNILQLPIEILEYILDYLDLYDLIDVGKTCKWMQKVAGNCFKQNYAGLSPGFYRRNGIFHVDYYFIQSFDKIRIMEPTKERYVLYKFLELKSEFHALKKLITCNVNFNNITIDSMKEVLCKLEYLHMYKCEMNENFLQNILAIAPNIKRLSLMNNRSGNQWLTHVYPTLEHCEIRSNEVMPITTFLMLNPHIRKFGTNFTNIWENRSLIQSANIKLDYLAIEVDNKSQFHSLCQLLTELHQIGFYKYLKFLIFLTSLIVNGQPIFDQEMVDEMVNLTAMVKLNIWRCVYFDRVALSDLVHLEDLSFADSSHIIDIVSVANRLENLERIHFGKSKLEHVKMFMSTNVKLDKIEIDWFIDESGNIEEDKILNLFQLNKIRAQLPNAKTITLYVEEGTYLATKHANRETNFELVKLKRSDTYNDRNFDFNITEFYEKESQYIHDVS